MFGEIGEIVVVDVLGMTFPEDWLCSLTVMAPKVVGATCLTKFRPIAGLCAMRKVLGYVWLKSLLPLRYESVQTAFRALSKLKNGKGSPDQITADFLKAIASRMFGEIGEIVVDVLGYDFPGRLAVLFDGNGSESGGCNVFDEVQANCWAVCDAKSLGLCVAHVTPSTAVRECADSVCAGDARRCWAVSDFESGRTVSRMAERKCGGTAADHRAAFKAMKLQGVSMFPRERGSLWSSLQ